jgi:predicted CXXCH cytochrome family protein
LGGARFATEFEKVNALCLGCHAEQRGQFHQNSRHPLFEGRMTCTDCHNPHEGPDQVAGERLRLVQGVEDHCARCHADKRGPFIFEHDMAATGDGCLTCHQAHGSPNNKLLKLNGRALCLQCHSDINLDPDHLTRPGNCWRAGCHADIHGSQESRVFLRAAGAAVAGLPGNGGAHGVLASRRREFAHLAALLRGEWGRAASVVTFDEVGSAVAATEAVAPAPGDAAGAPAATEEGAKGSPWERLTAEALLAYQGLDTDGNRSKAYQYTVPPSGLFLDALRLQYQDEGNRAFGSGYWTGVDEPRQTAALRLEQLGPMGIGPSLRYGYDRAAFFVDPSPDPLSASDRKDQAVLLRWLPSRRGPEARFVAESQRVEAPGVSRLATNGQPDALDYSNEVYAPQALLPLGGGRLRLQYAREEFSDRTRFLPGARSDGGFVRFDRFVGANTSLFAQFGRASVEQGGLPGHAVNQQLRLGATALLAPRLTAQAHLALDDIRQPNTLNAYARDRDLFVARLRYQVLTRLSLEGAYERAGFRWLNNPQTFVHTPRWDGGWLAVRARPTDTITLFARHRIRRLSDAPPAEIAGLPQRLPLFYDDDDRTDAQLTFLLPRDALLYLNYGRDRRQNDARGMGFEFDMLNAGLAMPLTRVLSLNADWSRQEWSGRGDALTRDPLRLNFGRPLTSDGDAINLGLAYFAGGDRLTMSLYRFTASGGESVRAWGALLGYEPRWSQWLVSPRFAIGWDDYDDRVLSGLDFSDTFVRVDLARRF